MNSYLVAVRHWDGAKEMYRVGGVTSFGEADLMARNSGFRVALVLVQPIATAVQEAA